MKEKRILKIKNKSITYTYNGMQMAREVVAIEKYIKGAYELAEESLKQIKIEDSMPYFGAIFGSIDEFSKKHVSDAYASIIKKIESGLNIIRAKKFVSKERKFEADTFSSADPKDGRTIRIYDAFFREHKDDAKNLNDRSSVILHEVAHLVGLTGDVETDSVKSAECLRNFTLLACEIVSPEDLFSPNGSNEPEKSKDSQIGMLGDLPYDPSQPRAPRGTSIGGQWIKANGGSSGSGKSKNKSNYKGRYGRNPNMNGMPHPDKDDKPIDINKFYRDIDFNPDGSGEKMTAVKNPFDALSVPRVAEDAQKTTERLFPQADQHNDEADAFRHAYFSYRLAEKIGSSEAKKFGDAHERTDVNDPSETAMDLMNIKIGRDLYDRFRRKGQKDAEKLVMAALKIGLLRTKPYDIKDN